MKLTILIPAYNEEKTIADCIKSIDTSFPKINEIEILVIDDGSSDKTAELARDCGAVVYSFSQNKGLAKAISYGFSKAQERKTDLLVILDADNQYDPKEIPLLLEPILEKKSRCCSRRSSNNETGSHAFTKKNWKQVVFQNSFKVNGTTN